MMMSSTLVALATHWQPQAALLTTVYTVMLIKARI